MSARLLLFGLLLMLLLLLLLLALFGSSFMRRSKSVFKPAINSPICLPASQRDSRFEWNEQ